MVIRKVVVYTLLYPLNTIRAAGNKYFQRVGSAGTGDISVVRPGALSRSQYLGYLGLGDWSGAEPLDRPPAGNGLFQRHTAFPVRWWQGDLSGIVYQPHLLYPPLLQFRCAKGMTPPGALVRLDGGMGIV